MSRTRIKICGIRDSAARDAAVSGGADFLGFVHWTGSPRYIDPPDARELARGLPDTVAPVGLFVDASLDEMTSSPFAWVQLHGSENEATCESVKTSGKNVIRGFRFDVEQLARWDACEAVDAVLVDGSSVGGEGLGFDYGVLCDLLPRLSKPLLLAGGLNPENVADAIQRIRPWGVDVSSGVERERGEKDLALIEAFCTSTRAAN